MGVNAVKKFMNNQSGFSLIEVTLAFGILGAVLVGTMSFMKEQNTITKTQNYRQDVQEFTDQIFKHLSSREACKNTFGGQLAASTTVTEIKDKIISDPAKFTLNTEMGSFGVKLASITLADTAGLEDMVEVKPGEGGTTRLILKFVPVVSSQSASYEVQKTINLWVLTDGTDPLTARIQECYSLVSGGSLLWSKDPLNPNNIYYNEGFVGVDQENPQTQLDVSGRIGIVTGTEVLDIGGNATQFELRVSDVTKPIEFLNQITSGWADVRARNITVNSYVKLSTNSSPCDASNNGAIKYNSTTKLVEMCESGAWVSKQYETWCYPAHQRKEQDDNAMWFFQNDSSRREIGTGCDRAQIDGRADNTGYGDLSIGPPNYGYRIYHDHADAGSYSAQCVNDQGCQSYRDVDQ